jgi:hypothetical protein
MSGISRDLLLEKKWSYWNFLSELVPENVDSLSDGKKRFFMEQWKGLVHTKNVQSRDSILRNIHDLPPIGLQSVPEWVMDRVKEVADDYVRGRWLSAIAVCGVIAEFLSFHLLDNYWQKEGIEGLIRHSRKLGSQEGRLTTLKELRFISERERKTLDSIREIRNKYVHLNRISSSEERIKPDCLRAVKSLVHFLNTHKLFQLEFR